MLLQEQWAGPAFDDGTSAVRDVREFMRLNKEQDNWDDDIDTIEQSLGLLINHRLGTAASGALLGCRQTPTASRRPTCRVRLSGAQ